MSSETYTPETPLVGDLAVEARAASIEPGFAVKGLFFDKLRGRLGEGWDEVKARLDAAPRLGRYVPFNNYPLGDYLRLIEAVARANYPDVALREGFRLSARDDFAIFADTTLGKIVLAAVGDPKSAMLAMGSVYTKMAPGDWSVIVSEVDDRSLSVRWENIPGHWEYQLGQTEGLVMSYDMTPTITVTELEPRRVRFDVTLS
jgi:uncharacterized protein (TIGR02265 family)